MEGEGGGRDGHQAGGREVGKERTGGVDGTHRQVGRWGMAREGGGRKGEERGGWKWAEEAAGSFIITEDRRTFRSVADSNKNK